MSGTAPTVHDDPHAAGAAGRRFARLILYAAGCAVILLLAAYLRFEGLGFRSLWRDEFCTWQVSRMPFVESLSWGPELTKPPLYQVALRAITSDPHPSEAVLRFPAAVCGLLIVAAGWWFGRAVGGLRVGLALAGLLAVNALQIAYSREARPYSMFVLGSLVSTALWFRLVTRGRRLDWWFYVVVTAATMYAHYLAGLTILAQVIWWAYVSAGDDSARRIGRGRWRPPVAMIVTVVLCAPVVVRYFRYNTSMFQGLEWIEPSTLERALSTLSALTFRFRWHEWLIAILLPSVVLWFVAAARRTDRFPRFASASVNAGRNDICTLLLIWLACAWFGLQVISWLTHPAMVARYALPAAIPALLFPLIVGYRLHRHVPIVLMGAFVIAAAPDWIDRQVAPGFREMAKYLEANVDPARELAVLTLDNTIYPGWEDSERLGFRYYPMDGVPLKELRLTADGVTAESDVLQDPRGMYLIVLWADPMKILHAAGRTPVNIEVNGKSFSRLLFAPYRLVRVAPGVRDAAGS